MTAFPADDCDGEQITQGRYPVVNVVEAWELWSMLGVLVPGIDHYYREDDNERTAWMVHTDGSWARATSRDSEAPTVHQGGPRQLWDIFDDISHTWLSEGSLPLYGAKVRIGPDGAIHLRRGSWQATVAK